VGQVYDLDVSEGRNRIVVMVLRANSNLIAEASSLGVLGVLQTALTMGTAAEITYEPCVPNRILAAAVSVPPSKGDGRVRQLRYDEATSQAEVRISENGSEILVTTKDARLQTMLQTAMREGRPLGEVQYDPVSKAIDPRVPAHHEIAG
jgi:hypothetical protein